MANEVEKGNHGQLQQSIGSVGAFSADEAPVAFAAAYWAWLRGERTWAPQAQEYGLAHSQAAGLVRQIRLTDEFRKLRK
jgi:hypothetical protein